MQKPINSKNILLPYTLILLGLVSLMQIINYIRAPKNDVLTALILVVIAAYYYIFNLINKVNLKKIRFGFLISHFICYLIVNLSYLILAFIIFADSTITIIGDGFISIPKQWSGALFFMPIFWGLGLLIHTIVSIAQRGFEEK